MGPIKLRFMVMSESHVSTLLGHSHEQITLFGILARFFFPMVNMEVAHFIRAHIHCQLLNPLSHEAQKILCTVYSDTPFYMVSVDLWEPGDIPDQDGYQNILTCMDCMTGFGLGSASGMK